MTCGKRAGSNTGEDEIAKQALKLMGYAQAIPVTHPSRLSGYNREVQPWRVFCACCLDVTLPGIVNQV